MPGPAPDRTHRVGTSDGLTLVVHAWDARATDPGTGPGAHPVLLHHGFSASALVEWPRTGLVHALLTAGRRVLALDARGHGGSDKPHDPARYGEARMAADVVDVLDALDVPVVDLVGYSMGSVVSLLVASAHPGRVHRLAVGGVGAGIVEVGGVDTRALPATRLAEALRSPDPEAITDPLVRGFREFAEQTGNDLLALAAQADAVHAAPLALDRITAPTLVLAGDADPLAERPEVLAGAVPGARLQRVRGDHGQALLDPGFAASITGFLDR
nr:alpha/beta hydrolase [Kineococcus aurantiacus]